MSAIVRHAIEINVVLDDSSASAADIKPELIACNKKAFAMSKYRISRNSAEKGARPRILIADMKDCPYVSKRTRSGRNLARFSGD
jgi:hypothetical protein